MVAASSNIDQDKGKVLEIYDLNILLQGMAQLEIAQNIESFFQIMSLNI